MHPRWTSYDAASQEQALSELVRRRSMIRNFTADAVFQFVSPQKRMTMKGKVSFSPDFGWRIELNGPLGVKLAVIEADEKRCILNLPQIGETVETAPEEELEIPQLDIRLPSPLLLTSLLLPTVDISDGDSWTVAQSESGWPRRLSLRKVGGSDSLVLSLASTPLQIFSEERWRSGRLLYKRRLEYKSNPNYLPDRIAISFGDLMLNVKYNSMRMGRDFTRRAERTVAP